jgi:ABC-2 type transport system ATP-binding protein
MIPNPLMVISVKSLSKRFTLRKKKVHVALDEVSFDIAEGELVGYIGPNGAGKSTTVKILSGILVPDSGSVTVLGQTPWKGRKEIVRQLGVVFGQKTQLWWDLPVMESLITLKAIYNLREEAYNRTFSLLVDMLNLSPLLHVPVRQLSLGQRMRCDLAASLLHSPSILFLDEPTIGLDATAKLAVRDFIRTLNRDKGTTVILTTHDMDDIEALCRRILLLNEGKIYFDGPLSKLREHVLPERRLIVDLSEIPPVVKVTGATLLKQNGHRFFFSFNPALTPASDLIASLAASYPITDLFVENPPIEELIAKFYKDGH